MSNLSLALSLTGMIIIVCFFLFTRKNPTDTSKTKTENKKISKLKKLEEKFAKLTITLLSKNKNNRCGLRTKNNSYPVSKYDPQKLDFVYVDILLPDSKVLSITIRCAEDYKINFGNLSFTTETLCIEKLKEALIYLGVVDKDLKVIT
jgi:hypothetical protein